MLKRHPHPHQLQAKEVSSGPIFDGSYNCPRGVEAYAPDGIERRGFNEKLLTRVEEEGLGVRVLCELGEVAPENDLTTSGVPEGLIKVLHLRGGEKGGEKRSDKEDQMRRMKKEAENEEED